MKSQITELIEIDEVIMSNFDHCINYEAANKIMDGKHYSQYSGWNFCGYVYYDVEAEKFICEIWVYNSLVEIIKCKTLELIMENVCNNYGDE